MHRVRSWAINKAHGRPQPAPQRRPSVARPVAAPASDPPASGSQPNIAEAPGLNPAGVEIMMEKDIEKKPWYIRFFLVSKSVLLYSWINVLLVFVPVGIAVEFATNSAGLIFAMNALAIIPLAGLLSHATESVASNLGDTIGALLNVTFGNAVELIIFIIALVKNEIRIVQASLLGSILSNLLLILGMAFFLGGLRFREQIYNSTVTQMSACLLSLSVTSLLLPTAFHASFNDLKVADEKVLQVSRGVSVILLLVYALYLVFQLNSHAYIYESTPQEIVEREAQPGPAANYFASSSSSDSSSSESSDSSVSSSSGGTRQRIKRAFRRRSHKRRSTMTSTDGEGDMHPIDENPAEGDDEGGASRGKRQKHRRRHKRSDAGPSQENEPNPETDGAPGLQETPNVPAVGANAAPERKDPGHGAEPDLEAQSSAPTRPHLSLLLPIRPVISQTLSQTVFSKPKDRSPAPSLVPEAQRRGRITGPRRTNSLPANLNQMDQTYRTPGAIPPFNPILVNSTAKSGDGEKPEQSQRMSRTAAVILLLASTGLVALCAEFMVDSINEVVESNSGISEAFIGLILLPIVGNAAEHVTAVTVAMKNKMDLAIGVAVGSSIQIAIFVTPLIVLLGWILNKNMSLYFTLFETVSMFVSAFIVNFLVLDGRSNYLEGALLISAYVIIAVAAFFYPSSEERSAIGGGDADIEERAVRDVVAAIAAKWLA